MPVISRTALLNYSSEQMYALVDDIKAYPEFLPWCTAATELKRTEDEVMATLELAKGGLTKSFTTCNRLQKNKMIEVRLVEGPFKHLEGFWRFESIDDQVCNVYFDLEFEFSSHLISVLLGPIFKQITQTMLDAFVNRAKALYGESNG